MVPETTTGPMVALPPALIWALIWAGGREGWGGEWYNGTAGPTYLLQDSCGQFLSQLLLVVPQVAGLVLLVLRREGREWPLWVGGLGDVAIPVLGVLTTEAGGVWAPRLSRTTTVKMVFQQSGLSSGGRDLAPHLPPVRTRGSYQTVPVGFCFGNRLLDGLFSHPQGDSQGVHHAVSYRVNRTQTTF